MSETGPFRKIIFLLGLIVAVQIAFFTFLPIRFSVLFPAYLVYLLLLRYGARETWGKMVQVEFFALVPLAVLSAADSYLYKKLANDLLVGWAGIAAIGFSFVLRMVLLQVRAKKHQAHNLLMIITFLFMILSLEMFLQESRIGLLYKMHNLGRSFVADRMLLWMPEELAYNRVSNPSSLVQFTIQKPKDKFRIVFFGGSATAGAELENATDAFPFAIQRSLGADRKESRIQVINAGIPSYTTFQIRRLIEMTGEKAAADIFVFYVGFNDSMERPSPYTQKEIWEILYGKPQNLSKQGIGFFQRTLGRLRTYQLLVRSLLPMRQSLAALGAANRTRTVSDPEMAANLQALLDFCNTYRIRMALCFEATSGPAPRPTWNTLNDFAQAHPEILSIDVDSIVRQLPGYENLFFDDVHLTREGHRVVAEIILKGLVEKGMIPG